MTEQGQVMPPRRNRGVLARVMNDLGFGQPPHISIKGGRFSLVDAAGNRLNANFVDQQLGFYLDVVVADANEAKSKIFFGREYQEGDDQPPACWSDNGIGPSKDAQEPQSPTCAVCPNNVLGSAISRLTGDPIKACRDQQKLAVFVLGAPMPEQLYLLVVTPGSLKNLRAYAGQLSTHRKDIADVVTRIYFVPNATGVINFVPTSDIDARMDQMLDHAAGTDAGRAICGRDDVPRPEGMPLLVRPAQPQQQLPPPPQQQFQQAPPIAQAPHQPMQHPQQPAPPPPPQQFQQAPPAANTAPPPQTRRRPGRPTTQGAPPPPPAPNGGAPAQAPFMQGAQPSPAPQGVAPGFHQGANTGVPAGLRAGPPRGFEAPPPANAPVSPPPPMQPPAAQYGMVPNAPQADPATQEALRNAFSPAATPPRPQGQ